MKGHADAVLPRGWGAKLARRGLMIVAVEDWNRLGGQVALDAARTAPADPEPSAAVDALAARLRMTERRLNHALDANRHIAEAVNSLANAAEEDPE